MRCRIEVTCPESPSEDPEKVRTAISNVFGYRTLTRSGGSGGGGTRTVVAVSDDLGSLNGVCRAIRAGRYRRACRRALQRNLEGDTTWFYLNKQAALAGRVAVCDEAQESPLGPIRVVVTSPEIDRLVDWMAGPRNPE